MKGPTSRGRPRPDRGAGAGPEATARPEHTSQARTPEESESEPGAKTVEFTARDQVHRASGYMTGSSDEATTGGA